MEIVIINLLLRFILIYLIYQGMYKVLRTKNKSIILIYLVSFTCYLWYSSRNSLGTDFREPETAVRILALAGIVFVLNKTIDYYRKKVSKDV